MLLRLSPDQVSVILLGLRITFECHWLDWAYEDGTVPKVRKSRLPAIPLVATSKLTYQTDLQTLQNASLQFRHSLNLYQASCSLMCVSGFSVGLSQVGQ